MALTAGQVLQNRYRIAALLGTGGMGAVYRAWDLRLEKPVALKELMPQPGLAADALAQLRAQFRQEAVVLGKLKHPHLVPVTDYFEEAGNDYLVMEFVEGESLASLISRAGALPESQVVVWARQLLDALIYCHAQGVLHRDVKPQNVIITPAGAAVLVDFGLVKLWDPADPVTRTVMRGVGTPEYSPPEQWGALSHHTDPRSDLYSLGATLYHALAGKAPPTASDRMAYPTQFRTPRQWTERVSEALDGVITKAMALSCDDRWPDAAAMDAALAAVEVQTEGVGVDTDVMAGVPAAPALEMARTEPMYDAAAAPPGRRGAPPIWIVWVVLGVVMLASLSRALGLVGGGAPQVAPTTIPTRRPVATTARPAATPARTQAAATAEQAAAASPIEGKYPLAVILPLSGDAAAYGQSLHDGVMLAIDEWNARGGIGGKAIHPIVDDGGCNANQAIDVANRIIREDDVKVIIGEACSSASIAISEIADDRGILMISPASTNHLVTLRAGGATKPTVFRACFVDAFQGKVAARFALDVLGARTAAVLLDAGNAYVRDLANEFIAQFEAAGGAVVAGETYVTGQRDFTPLLDRVKAGAPDVLFLPDTYHVVNAIARQARDAGISATLLGGDGWDSPELDLAATAGGYFVSHFSPDDIRPVVQDFVRRFADRYGRRPDALAALGYDSVDLYLRAVVAAGSDDPLAVARALESGRFELVTGTLAFDAGHSPSKDAVMLRVEDGAVVYAGTVPGE